MADEKTPPQPEGGQPHPLMINTQYVKDLSFENPSAPKSLLTAGDPPSVQINVDVQAYKVAKDTDMFEVTLSIAAEGRRENEPMFLVELLYAGVFTISGAAAEQLEPILLIECPRLLFPFARAVISDATREGGYAPLLIHPIDFAGLYIKQKQAGAAGIRDKEDAQAGEDAGKQKAKS